MTQCIALLSAISGPYHDAYNLNIAYQFAKKHRTALIEISPFPTLRQFIKSTSNAHIDQLVDFIAYQESPTNIIDKLSTKIDPLTVFLSSSSNDHERVDIQNIMTNLGNSFDTILFALSPFDGRTIKVLEMSSACISYTTVHPHMLSAHKALQALIKKNYPRITHHSVITEYPIQLPPKPFADEIGQFYKFTDDNIALQSCMFEDPILKDKNQLNTDICNFSKSL